MQYVIGGKDYESSQVMHQKSIFNVPDHLTLKFMSVQCYPTNKNIWPKLLIIIQVKDYDIKAVKHIILTF